ncbi:AzlC family ABC transporter permease [Pseudogulbenkiania sp. MAI-1]|uniref:AzlC family ABC transporter permease n=1 Tax=Pseudogulbenkiania sp. MAI-1 TaxID=990370 RepID=UPI000A06B195|nr:AzlC family ABC transporter permease [Pseudogulbenkiania sp. MAI-1]
MNEPFKTGLKEGFHHYLPFSVGLIPWGLAAGVAMRSAGFSLTETMGMNIIVFGGTAQLGTLPLIISGTPLWLIVVTALILNLRFVVFSATLAPAFSGTGRLQRWLSSYLLSDGVTASCASRLLTEQNSHWRFGYYLGPSLWNWWVWQASTLIGALATNLIPKNWPLEFMATTALLALLIPLIRQKPMLLAAIIGGSASVVLHDLPLRLGFIIAIITGIVTGTLSENWLIAKDHKK